MYAVIYTDGHMSIKAIATECIEGEWLPLATYQNKILLFHQDLAAAKFAKKNLPNGWPIATFHLTDFDLDWIKAKNLEVEILGYPKRLAPLSFEVIETFVPMDCAFTGRQP